MQEVRCGKPSHNTTGENICTVSSLLHAVVHCIGFPAGLGFSTLIEFEGEWGSSSGLLMAISH